MDSLTQDADLCLNPTHLPSVSVEVPSATLPLPFTSPDTPCSPSLLHPCGPLCDCANCAALPSTPLPDAQDSPCSLTSEDMAGEAKGEEGKLLGVSEPLPVPELLGLSLEEKRPAVACYVAQQQETLVQLQRSGLVRRRAERLERLSGLSQEGLHPLEPLDSPHSGAREGPSPVEVEFSAFPEDFPKSSTPCPVPLELLEVPLTNEALLGAVGSGGLTPNSSPHGSTLTRSSSSDSIRSVRGKPGLVRQRAQEIETRMRLAGLTVPSSLKRSNSLAKLGSLNFSAEDLCSVCSSDAGTLLLLSLSPEPGLEWECPSTSSSAQPRAHRDQTTPERALSGGPRS